MSIAKIAIVTTEKMLLDCLSIRRRVFVDEQHVPEDLEMDSYDSIAVHYLMTHSENPVGTARLIDKDGVAKIGRVAIVSEARGNGFGLQLMNFIIDDVRNRGFVESILDAQTYAVPFYERLGYHAYGDIFDDAGIPHLHMRAQL